MTSRSAPGQQLLLLATLLPALALAVPSNLQVQHSAVTRVRAVKSNFHWTISNFTLYKHKPGDLFQSPIISTYDEDVKLNWTVLVYPHGMPGNDSDESFGVFLVYSDGELDEMRVRYTVHLLDAEDEDLVSVEDEEVVQRGLAAGIPRLLGTDEVLDPANGALVDDALRVFVEFAAIVGDRSYSNECRRGAEEPPYTAHLEPYLGSFEYSDLTISAGGSEFRAHRLLLAARSSVFDEIFKTYGTGHAILKFTMEDFGAEVVAEALRYVYTGRIGALTGARAAELLALTYKYEIDGLKDLVMEGLCLALDLDPEDRARALEEIEYDAREAARRLPVDAQKACSIVPINLSKNFEIE